MTPLEFILKWRRPRFGERQGAQSFFNDLCAAVGHPAPAEYANPDIFTFEKYNNGGSADVYYEDHFAWEFKSRDAYLDDGMNQLLRYQIHLKTPPLLIVSSFRHHPHPNQLPRYGNRPPRISGVGTGRPRKSD